MRYRKKPIEIEAVRFVDDNFDVNNFNEFPDWLKEEIKSEIIIRWKFNTNIIDGPLKKYFEIKTLEGVMRLNKGDWLIRGVKGELYPCKDDIFKMTYERVME
jgi:hypothetical protein